PTCCTSSRFSARKPILSFQRWKLLPIRQICAQSCVGPIPTYVAVESWPTLMLQAQRALAIISFTTRCNMTMISGEVRALAPPIGGGVHVNRTRYVYADGSPSEVKSNWYKSRMVFPSLRVGDVSLDGSYVANDQLGHEIADNIHLGDRVRMFV